MDLSKLAAALAPLNLRSCLISRKGEMIFEHYRDLHAALEIAKINSCTKSILSALLCIAMDRKLLPQPNATIGTFFPQASANRDPRLRDITLWHLLTMTAGFDWTEFGGQNSFPRMTRSHDWVEFVLEQPFRDPPGVKTEYNSGISQLLSAILVQATGMPVARFAELNLFEPLGIDSYKWERDPQGIHTGGFGLWLRPYDMLKFGQLFLQQGNWENRQLISRDLALQSVQPAISVEAPRRGFYAWHWWADSYGGKRELSPASSFDYFYARGFGGQFIHVIPELETVVVLSDDKRKKAQFPGDVFRQFIAPLFLRF
ncbi:serine hydrolase domain-containing protein [Fontibacillus sp. BL9]|uniref:serine hydrolase domain-containing protein n=1 Tax=Fontibacillus sp. BL9 TaxID=3389971 RepID=UPI00397BD518